MNKLVSKNSILRFKLGRKIEKLQKGRYIKVGRSTFGDTIWADTTTGDLYKGNSDPNDPHSHYSKGWIEPGGKGHLGKSTTYYNLISGRGTINGSDYIRKSNSTNQQQLLQTTDYSLMKGGTRLRSAEEQKKWEAEVQRLKNLMKNDPRKVINKQKITPRFLSKYSNMESTIGGANNIKAWLQKLKNYYAPGTYNPDSIWGANTQAAYDRYLADQAKLSVKFTVPSITEPTQNELSELNRRAKSITVNPTTTLLNEFALDKQINYPSISRSTAQELFDKVILRDEFKTPYNPNFNWKNAPKLSYYPKLNYYYAKQGIKLIPRKKYFK